MSADLSEFLTSLWGSRALSNLDIWSVELNLKPDVPQIKKTSVTYYI